VATNQTAELAALARQLEELNRIGAALSAERDTSRLLELILTKARAITASDAGSLYVVERPVPAPGAAGAKGEDAPSRLRFMIAQNDSTPLPFVERGLEISDRSIAGYVAMSGRIVALEDAYRPPLDAPYTVDRSFDEMACYRTRSVLAAPMRTPQGHIVGVLQLINAKRDAGVRLDSTDAFSRDVIPYSPQHEALVESLAAQAAIALENSQLYAAIEQLFEGFVRASIVAIESRDPATSGHSFRVANLTVALAEAVNRADHGPFAAIRFSREEMRTIRYASLLHDFGKVGVREEILVKAKKLYPEQLESIRERFKRARCRREVESMRRRVDCLMADGPDAYQRRLGSFERELADDIQRLEGYLGAIELANEPTTTASGSFERLRDIAAVEFIDLGGQPQPLLSAQEVTLLSLRKGTLSEAERSEIQSHVAHTYDFLRQIPWMPETSRIPAITLGHHEFLNGTGYPHRLRESDIPIQARMMTICDIFDAVSASDRPYKKAVPFERALDILARAVEDGELDRDLFSLFLEARVFDRWQVEPYRY
jgi:HD-GYP domain-containing protein (c-di-GMP phosphodiesterase class II)